MKLKVVGMSIMTTLGEHTEVVSIITIPQMRMPAEYSMTFKLRSSL
jgi:hypothetical protein